MLYKPNQKLKIKQNQTNMKSNQKLIFITFVMALSLFQMCSSNLVNTDYKVLLKNKAELNKYAEKVFAAMDVDKSKKIDGNELINIVSFLYTDNNRLADVTKLSSFKKDEFVKTYFAQYDLDKNGYLDPKEINSIVENTLIGFQYEDQAKEASKKK